MKVQDIMTRDVASCAPDTSLHQVAATMWDRDCGFVPVVDPASNKVCGVVTDRDACMAAYTTGRSLSELKAGDAMAPKVKTCKQRDDLAEVHKAMRKNQIRRMAVVDSAGKLVGVVSLNDLAIHAEKNGRDEAVAVATTLAEICQHRSMAAAKP